MIPALKCRATVGRRYATKCHRKQRHNFKARTQGSLLLARIDESIEDSMSNHSFLLIILSAFTLVLPNTLSAQEKKRPKLPNIIWITSEDHGPHMGCYGDKFARTPNIDKLAKKGM